MSQSSEPQAHTPLTALSPLDGRYASRLAALRPLLTEYGLMQRRVQVEVEWFIALSDAGFAEFKPLGEASRQMLRDRVAAFSIDDAQAIKDIEKTTNHDVKAVEYWLKRQFEGQPELLAAGEFVHFACTSEDINNTSHALMLKAARETVLLPALDRLLAKLAAMATQMASVPMLSRTHGQTASPTTVGKEIANVAARLRDGARAHRRGGAARQDERRGGQLQRAPGGLSRLRLGRLQPPRRRGAARPRSTRTRSRSSRTTTWPSCSTP